MTKKIFEKNIARCDEIKLYKTQCIDMDIFIAIATVSLEESDNLQICQRELSCKYDILF